MKTDRLLLVAIVAVMAAVVGYLFFSDEAAPGGRGDTAALQSATGEPRTTLGAFEEQKRLEQARKGCAEFELPSEFKGRSAEDIAAFFGYPSMAYLISTANGNADGFRAGEKIYAPEAWIAARKAASGAGGEQRGDALTGLGSEQKVAGAGGAGAGNGSGVEGERPVPTPVDPPKDVLAKGDQPRPSDEPAPKKVARANDPSETPRPWGFLMKNVPASGGSGTANREDARALPASTTAKPTPGQSYRAVSGDTLWKIAEAAYGKGSRYKEIARANESLVGSDGSLLRAGMVLRIP
jgi:LysM repeat protein